MYPRISPTLSTFTATAFFLLFLPASSIKRKRTHFSPPLLPRAFAVPVQPNQARSAIRISRLSLLLSILFFSLFTFMFCSFSVQLASILSATLVHNPAFPLLPAGPPFRPLSLSPSLAVVRARMSPISVDRQYIYASSPSLCREQRRRTRISRVRARDAARSREGGGRKGVEGGGGGAQETGE